MTILKIARMGHPVLRRRAEPVADPSAPEIHRLVSDMIDTMEDAPGIGLAAPQVHVPLRLVIFRVPAERLGPGEEGEAQGLTALCNPLIEPLGEETEPGWEGCLSIPGLRGVVERWTHIRYSGLGLDGRKVEREARGMHARVVQHECDHLDGILYPQRMRDLTKLVFESEMRHMVPDARVREDIE